MRLDPLERKVLMVMAAVCSLILALSFAAFSLGQSLGGTDEKVEGGAAEAAGATAHTPVGLPPWGEPLLFLLISSLAGLGAGYLLPDALERRHEHA